MNPFVISFTSEKGGVGKSTLVMNIAGALSLNGPTLLLDEDPIQTCGDWAKRATKLPFRVSSQETMDGSLVTTYKYLLVDTEGRPAFEDVIELVRKSGLVIMPCSPSGVELFATQKLIARLKNAEVNLEHVRVVINRAPPVGQVGQQARDALAEAGVPVAQTVIRNYTAHQRAAEAGVLVRDVSDPRASQAWQDIMELSMELVRR